MIFDPRCDLWESELKECVVLIRLLGISVQSVPPWTLWVWVFVGKKKTKRSLATASVVISAQHLRAETWNTL